MKAIVFAIAVLFGRVAFAQTPAIPFRMHAPFSDAARSASPAELQARWAELNELREKVTTLSEAGQYPEARDAYASCLAKLRALVRNPQDLELFEFELEKLQWLASLDDEARAIAKRAEEQRKAGNKCAAEGDYRAAVFELQQGLELARSIGDSKTLYAAEYQFRLAQVYHLNHEYDLAETAYAESLAVVSTEPTQGRLIRVPALLFMANLARDTAHTELAAQRYAQALDAAANEPNSVCWILSEQVKLPLAKRDFDAAINIYERIAIIVEAQYGRISNEYREALGPIAKYSLECGKLDKAEAVARSAMQIAKELGGEQSLPYAWEAIGLGRICRTNGDYAGAEQLFRTALSVAEKSQSTETQWWCKASLGALYLETGRYDAAGEILEAALAGLKQEAKPNQSDYARVLIALAGLATEKGDFERAKDLLSDAYQLDCKTTDSEMELAFGRFCLAKKDWINAVSILSVAVTSIPKRRGPNHLLVADAAQGLFAALFAQGNDAAAEQRLRQAWQIRSRVLSPKHPKCLETLESVKVFTQRTGRAIKLESEVAESAAPSDAARRR